MLKKKPMLICGFIIALISYGIIIYVTKDPFTFMTSFPLVCLASMFFGILNIHNTKRRWIISGCAVLFLVGKWVIHEYWLRNASFLISGGSLVGLFLYTLAAGWSVNRSHRKQILGAATGIFITLMIVLKVIAAITDRPSDSSSLESLKSLPYLTWMPAKDPNLAGVVLHDPRRAFQGLNLYYPGILAMAHLIDMDGNGVHTWKADVEKVGQWNYVEMDHNGDLFAIATDDKLIRLDWNSNIKWMKEARFHHDVAIAENGDVYALIRKDALEFLFGVPVPVLNDYIVILSQTGSVKQEISLYHIVKRKIPVSRIYRIYRRMFTFANFRDMITRKGENRFLFSDDAPSDLLHNNTITIITQDIPGICKQGDILISVRELDLIGIVDLEQEKLVWSWGPGDLDRQHHPTMLANGNILVFDNGRRREYSRIIELDPRSNTIVWEYQATPPEQFFSVGRGSSQRLPNGNTLITESDKGRVFEITKDDDIVWEFYNPVKQHTEEGVKIAALYRMKRIIDPEQYPKLKEFMP